MVDPIATLTLNPALDKSTSIDHVVPEHKLRCEPPTYEPGGGGINVSRALAKLGGDSVAFYFAGGYTGQHFQQLLAGEGIRQQSIPIADMTRESFTVFEQVSNLQYRFAMPGPAVQEEEWRAMVEALGRIEPPPAYLVVSGSMPGSVPQTIFQDIAGLARMLDARLIVDTSGAALQKALDEGVYLIKPNMRELSLLAGRAIEDDADLERAARELVVNGQSHAVVVSLGAGGAFLVTEEGCVHFRSPTVPIASKVGAGDSMVAGIVLTLARGGTLEEAVRYGVAAGAAAVMTPGSLLCRREDTERLVREIAPR